MRLRLFTMLAAITVLATFGFSASMASATTRAPSTAHHGTAARPASPLALTLLYDQNNNDAGVGIISQDFTDSGFDIYDSQGADDFTVPAGHKWVVKGVVVTGVYFNGAGPADSENVTIYSDSGGLPGAVRFTTTVTGNDNAGSFTLKIGKVKLRPGTYWVSVQATMAYAVGGEWGWETSTVQNGNAAAWQNPGGGFGLGCTSYSNMQGCIGAFGEGPDFMFALYGVQL